MPPWFENLIFKKTCKYEHLDPHSTALLCASSSLSRSWEIWLLQCSISSCLSSVYLSQHFINTRYLVLHKKLKLPFHRMATWARVQFANGQFKSTYPTQKHQLSVVTKKKPKKKKPTLPAGPSRRRSGPVSARPSSWGEAGWSPACRTCPWCPWPRWTHRCYPAPSACKSGTSE